MQTKIISDDFSWLPGKTLYLAMIQFRMSLQTLRYGISDIDNVVYSNMSKQRFHRILAYRCKCDLTLNDGQGSKTTR